MELKEDCLLVHPEGFVKPEQQHLVCRLKKALCSLKQAPRSWYVKIDSSFMRSKNDPNLYIKKYEDEDVSLTYVYV